MEPAEDRALRLARPVETPVPVLLLLVPVPPATTMRNAAVKDFQMQLKATAR